MGVARASVADGELAYEVTGTGRAVVLLHAGLMDMTMWDEQFELLAPGYRVLRFDARGHGGSTPASRPYRSADDLRDLLAQVGLERATLVGLSLGARTAVDTALRHPGLVEAMLLAGPGVSGMKFSDPVVAEATAAMDAAAQAGDLDGCAEAMLRAWVDGPLRRPDQVDPAVRERCRRMAVNNLARQGSSRGRLIEEGAIHRLGEIRVPTRTVIGDLDSADIASVAGAIQAQAPGAVGTTVLPGAGHMVNLDRPAEFNRCLLGFLTTGG